MNRAAVRPPLLPIALLLLAATASCDKDKDKKVTAPSASGSAESLAVPTQPPVSKEPASAAPSPSAPAEAPVVDLVVGTGKEARDGSKVKVHYTLWLASGTRVESSHDKGKPKSFIVGGGQVIRGWDSGVVGMKVGGKRRLNIPPELGYGGKGSLPTIPPNAKLVFELELIEVQ